MDVKQISIFTVDKAPNTFAKSIEKKREICLCKSIRVLYVIGRILGVSPVCWKHEGDTCVFKSSILWICYSIIFVVGLLLNFTFFADFTALTDKYVMPVLLNAVTDCIYYLYFVTVVILNTWKSKKWAKVLNDLSKMARYGLICESSLKTVRNLIYAFFIFWFFIVFLHGAVLGYLHFSSSYESEFNLVFVVDKILQNAVLTFYVFLFSIIALLIGLLTCFEKLSIDALNYSEIYPMKKITGSDNQQDIFVFFSYEVCKSEHKAPPELLKLPTAEVIEYFRILHEEISEIMYEINNCANPLLMIHVVIEILVLVINWYSVIIAMAYEFHSKEIDAVFVISVIFSISHSIGLFVFLRNAQKLSNMIHGYASFLMEYSTRVTSTADHLQLRIFIEKIKQHKPLTANGIFTIDLGIAGPIFANILTYVLVALQFKIPQAEN